MEKKTASKKTLPAKTPTTLEGIADRNIYLKSELPSGKTLVINRFKGKHSIQARNLMDKNKNGEDFAECLASVICELDGQKFVPEDLMEMDGMDYLKIMKPINELFL